MNPSMLRAGAVLALLCPTAIAQMAIAPHSIGQLHVDSGYLHNPTGEVQTLFETTVTAADAAWLQVHFGAVNLPEGSRLRLTAIADGAIQWFDGRSLREYSQRSAFFNGSDVKVELVAGPYTRANRLVIEEYMGGDGFPVSLTTKTTCGPTDDRQPSNDPRAGRQHPSTCTTWMISPTVALTAGHCSSTTQQVHFNCPLSTSTGSIVLPSPNDQYPYDGPTLRRLNSGVGADWSVVAIVRNSNTGLYPGQAQGSWYDLGAVPVSGIGTDHIRITGYGSTGTGVPRTYNFAQKTHLGGLANIAATSLGYRTDTSGGNSGSPIIHFETGDAVGIHTHGGCTFSGGYNQGTRIDRSDLQQAIAATLPLRTAGIFAPIGTGCSGGAGAASLSATGFPDLGATMSLDVTGVEPNQMGVMVFGLSDTTWNGNPLPVQMGACQILISLDVAVALPTGASGAPSLNVQIPDDEALTGGAFFNQYFAIDSTVGIVSTNASRSTIGD